MEMDSKYPIVEAETLTTKLGSTVLLSIKVTQCNNVNVLMPKRYRSVFSNEDFASINSLKSHYSLFIEDYVGKKSYILAIE
jgi:hypothetical protein